MQAVLMVLERGNNFRIAEDTLDVRIIADDLISEARLYWEAFDKNNATKLKDWQHEQEYRIPLHSPLLDLSSPAMRKLRYRFEDLQGVIFGIKTTLEDKLAVVRILQTKCAATPRTDFELHQAYYSRLSGNISTIAWDLVRLG